jgi:hypothetical protein
MIPDGMISLLFSFAELLYNQNYFSSLMKFIIALYPQTGQVNKAVNPKRIVNTSVIGEILNDDPQFGQTQCICFAR